MADLYQGSSFSLEVFNVFYFMSDGVVVSIMKSIVSLGVFLLAHSIQSLFQIGVVYSG